MTTSLSGRNKLAAKKIEREDAVIAEALSILASRIRRKDILMASPNAIKTYLICKFGQYEQEVFSVLWCDAKHWLIEHEILFFGSLTHCAVYPREIVKSGLRLNAAVAVFVHNHPSGDPEPSPSDFSLTKALTCALALIDIRVIDHLIVGGTQTHSFAEHDQI